MIKNMGTADRVIRLILAALLFWLAFGGVLTAFGVFYWLALVVGVVFALTAAFGHCPLYRVVGMNTCGN